MSLFCKIHLNGGCIDLKFDILCHISTCRGRRALKICTPPISPMLNLQVSFSSHKLLVFHRLTEHYKGAARAIMAKVTWPKVKISYIDPTNTPAQNNWFSKIRAAFQFFDTIELVSYQTMSWMNWKDWHNSIRFRLGKSLLVYLLVYYNCFTINEYMYVNRRT